MSEPIPAREWRFYVEDMLSFCPDVPWRLVIALRNRLIHGYLGIDDDTLWSILRDELQPLRTALMELLGA